ncbi:MAG: Gfo/Idh/MocA family oxidoreductase, partial [Coriobacteriales bacterium]|nr:Gfo/Idh/MocA family oxidoreductase [Coriobacteriales bacterium]
MTGTTPIRVGVAGVGNMGRNHLRVLSTMPQFELVGLYDADAAAATGQAEQYGIEAFSRFEDMLEAVEAVHVVVPSFLHREFACAAAAKGRHVLVEKPIALTLEDADAIIAACEAQGVTLCVGHVERYNPAIATLADIVERDDIIAIDFRRLSPYDERVQDADVVHDLMVHDLDILNWLVPLPLRRLSAQGAQVHSDKLDYAQALLEYEGGTVASLTASRATESKIRAIQITGRKAFIIVDCLNRSVEISRKTHYTLDVGRDISYRQESIVEKVFVPFKEPLLAEFEEFARAIVAGDM